MAEGTVLYSVKAVHCTRVPPQVEGVAREELTSSLCLAGAAGLDLPRHTVIFFYCHKHVLWVLRTPCSGVALHMVSSGMRQDVVRLQHLYGDRAVESSGETWGAAAPHSLSDCQQVSDPSEPPFPPTLSPALLT